MNVKNGLPSEPADRFTRPFMRFLRIEAAAAAVLLLCTVVALVASNTSSAALFQSFWETHVGSYVGNVSYSRTLQQIVNDGLMTLFFFVVALEMKREMVLGELRNPRLAALPLAGALGGMLVPAALYLLLAGDGPAAAGWGTVMSTDTAFVIGCLAVLGRRIPESLRLFLLSLAIFDDIGAIVVVAVGYGHPLHWPSLAMVAVGLAAVAVIARLGIRSVPVYFALGAAIWVAMDASGIHATLTGVILGLMTPSGRWVSDARLHAILDRVHTGDPDTRSDGDTPRRRDLQRATVATREALSPIERLEVLLHPYVAFAIIPIFALANAGVQIVPEAFDISVASAIFVGFVIGKPVGVVAFSLLAVTLRVAIRPDDLPWSLVAAGSILAGIGFTMALFIAEAAFGDDLLDSAKVGILGASAVSAACGLAALAWLVSRPRPD